MTKKREFMWNGERNRALGVDRPCACGTCSRGTCGVGYLSYSDASGLGFTIWVEDERIFQALRRALRRVGLEVTTGERADDSGFRPV